MSDPGVMAFVGDLFPVQIEPASKVASVMVSVLTPDACRNAPIELREVVRTAAEWQGTVTPRRGLFRSAPPPATEADFLAAARRAYEKYGKR